MVFSLRKCLLDPFNEVAILVCDLEAQVWSIELEMPFLNFVYVHVCLCMWVYVHVHVEVRGQLQGSSLGAVCLLLLRQGLSLTSLIRLWLTCQ